MPQPGHFYRRVLDWDVSSVGIGTYLGAMDDATDRAYIDALVAAAENGINFFDTAINYRRQRSELNIGVALSRLRRENIEDIVVCTKAGFLTPGAIPATLDPKTVVAGMHCMAPDFLSDQIDRSRENLGVDTIDVFYLHNPETQLAEVPRPEFDRRIHAAFTRLEELVAKNKIRYYGIATWDGLRKGALPLPRLAELAGPHFRFIQLPFNLAMTEAFTGEPESVLQAAERLGIVTVASASLLQTRILPNVPDVIPGLATPAQRAIQFTRSTPGISVALVGMSKREHVLENIGVGRVPLLSREQYRRMYP